MRKCDMCGRKMNYGMNICRECWNEIVIHEEDKWK